MNIVCIYICVLSYIVLSRTLLLLLLLFYRSSVCFRLGLNFNLGSSSSSRSGTGKFVPQSVLY